MKKDELEHDRTVALSALMPLYRAGTFFPAKVRSQTETLEETVSSSAEEFREGLEEGNEDFEALRKLGRFSKSPLKEARDILSGEESTPDPVNTHDPSPTAD